VPQSGLARRGVCFAAPAIRKARYCDFNVWSERTFVEKLRYIHRNPVKRGLVLAPRIGCGAAFGTTLTAKQEWLRSSRSGRSANANRQGSFLP